jgi:hypothetical protein
MNESFAVRGELAADGTKEEAMNQQIRQAVEAVKASPYLDLVILLLEYVRWYCSGEAPCNLPDSLYYYITRGKWSSDPLVDMLSNSDISEQAQFLGLIVLNYENAAFAGELTDELEDANNSVFRMLYA